MDMTEQERLDFLVKHLGNGNAAEFARKIGVQPSAVSRIRVGREPLTQKYIEAIMTAFPQVERKWLESGDGYPGDISVELVKQSYELKLEKADALINTLIHEIERQGRIIESLIQNKTS